MGPSREKNRVYSEGTPVVETYESDLVPGVLWKVVVGRDQMSQWCVPY